MAKEKSGITGKWYACLRQQMGNSCAPACIRMMGIYINGSDPGEGTTRAYVSLAEGGTSSLGGGGVVSQVGHDFITTPTEPDPMVTALKSLRPAIKSDYIFEAITGHLLKEKLEVGPKNAMIIGVFWAGGGGHVMVGVDRPGASSSRTQVMEWVSSSQTGRTSLRWASAAQQRGSRIRRKP